MFAAHETRRTNAALMPEHQRKQQQWPTFGIIGDNDEGQEVLALSDLPLPGAEEIKTADTAWRTAADFRGHARSFPPG